MRKISGPEVIVEDMDWTDLRSTESRISFHFAIYVTCTRDSTETSGFLLRWIKPQHVESCLITKNAVKLELHLIPPVNLSAHLNIFQYVHSSESCSLSCGFFFFKRHVMCFLALKFGSSWVGGGHKPLVWCQCVVMAYSSLSAATGSPTGPFLVCCLFP